MSGIIRAYREKGQWDSCCSVSGVFNLHVTSNCTENTFQTNEMSVLQGCDRFQYYPQLKITGQCSKFSVYNLSKITALLL